MNESLSRFRAPLTPTEETILAGGYWHCTILANFRRIVRSGAILPNLGRFKARHSVSPQSKCARAGGVSLFEPWQAKARSWLLTWLASPQPLTVALRLDPAVIQPRALAGEDLSAWTGGIFLRGEVCVCGEIPLTCCTGLLILAATRERPASWMEPFDPAQALATLRELAPQRAVHKGP